MFAPPPLINRVSINSMNCEKLIDFFSTLGMMFNVEVMKNNLSKYTYIHVPFTFQICEVETPAEITKNASLRFLIDDIDGYLDDIEKTDVFDLENSWLSDSYQHILLRDLHGNKVELMTKR